MSEQKQSNLGFSLIRIHLVITRALTVSVERGRSFAQTGFPDASIQSGFACYARSLLSVLRGHHMSEDELAFPYLRQRLPEAPYEVLASEHRAMVRILPQVEAAIAQSATSAEPTAALNDLSQAVGRVIKIWNRHIEKEERHFSVSALAALIEPEEHVRMNRLIAEFSQQHSGPDYLVIPFMLFNLSGDHREAMSREFPPTVTEQLVPTVWRDKWEIMKPFLLP
jgi:iron-sulfur cluster repair protein YtfE (RIC family)